MFAMFLFLTGRVTAHMCPPRAPTYNWYSSGVMRLSVHLYTAHPTKCCSPSEYDILLFLTDTTASRYKIGGLSLEVSDEVETNNTTISDVLLPAHQILSDDWSSRIKNWINARDLCASLIPIHPSFIHDNSHRPSLLSFEWWVRREAPVSKATRFFQRICSYLSVFRCLHLSFSLVSDTFIRQIKIAASSKHLLELWLEWLARMNFLSKLNCK